MTVPAALAARIDRAIEMLDPRIEYLAELKQDARVALAELKEHAENEQRLLGMLYADYCVRTKPRAEDRGEWFAEIVHVLFPETLPAAPSSPETPE